MKTVIRRGSALIVACLWCFAASAGELVLKNSSDVDVWVVIHDVGAPPGAQCAGLWKLKPGDRQVAKIAGDSAYARAVLNGKACESDRAKRPMPFCDAAPFGIWRSEVANHYELRSKKETEPEIRLQYKGGTPLPEGWREYPHYRYGNGETLEIVRPIGLGLHGVLK